MEWPVPALAGATSSLSPRGFRDDHWLCSWRPFPNSPTPVCRLFQLGDLQSSLRLLFLLHPPPLCFTNRRATHSFGSPSCVFQPLLTTCSRRLHCLSFLCVPRFHLTLIPKAVSQRLAILYFTHQRNCAVFRGIITTLCSFYQALVSGVDVQPLFADRLIGCTEPQPVNSV